MLGNFFKDYFTFSRGERNGIIVLLLIIILLIFAYYLPDIFKVQKQIDFSQFKKEIEAFEQQQALAREHKERKTETAQANFELFEFDPNEITEDEWRKLGVHERTIRTIMNYRNKGGYFDEKSDLLKIYGFDSSKYEMLEPYIAFNKHEEEFKPDPFDKPVFKKERKYDRTEQFSYDKKPEYRRKENVIVELNTADSSALLAVRGIGPASSGRIIKYRERLGGFVSVEQLKEVYGMDSVWYEMMKPSLTVDGSLVSKISINSISQRDLAKHPYFDWNLSKAIVNYRQQHGRFSDVNDLKKIYLVDETLFEKIKPYVVID